jgi:thiamine biosynthesis protein ThiS
MITVNGDLMEWREGMALQEIMDAKKFVFPLLIASVNGEHVPKERYASTIVSDGANVQIIHMLSGG